MDKAEPARRNLKKASVYINRGVLYNDLKKWDLALDDYNRAIEIDPQNTDAYNNRASLYGELKKYDLALADFNQVLKIDPNYPNAYLGKGLVSISLQQKQQGIKDLETAAQLFYQQGDISTYQKIIQYLETLKNRN